MAPDSMNVSGGDISVNGRTYRLPRQPVVVVCVDGSEPGYIERAVEAGRAPWFARVLKEGTNLVGDCVVPSFTNPNNLSIVTGRPPAVHGICGNYFLDPETGKEVMMNDPKFLRVETLFPAFQRAGCRIALDDFGAGMSSFGYLKNLPVDLIKIDGSFIRDLETDPMSRTIVSAIAQIGHQRGLKVVAEWVASPKSCDALHSLGVDYGQGFALHRPERVLFQREQPPPRRLAVVR